jgi:hypothetical protein
MFTLPFYTSHSSFITSFIFLLLLLLSLVLVLCRCTLCGPSLKALLHQLGCCLLPTFDLQLVLLCLITSMHSYSIRVTQLDCGSRERQFRPASI